jgi:Protein of unknown function (DUF2798)
MLRPVCVWTKIRHICICWTYVGIDVWGFIIFIVFYEDGFSCEFLMKFLGAWQFSLSFSFIVAQFLTPLVRKFTMMIVESSLTSKLK